MTKLNTRPDDRVALPQPGRRKTIFIGIALGVLTLMAGGLATDIGPWYYGLEQPGWKPPDWAFGPAWTTIYILVTYGGLKAWLNTTSHNLRRLMLILLGFNLVVNVLWSVLFFTLKRPDFALLEVGVLWSSIVALIAGFGYADRRSILPMMPYLLWVSFAAVLNWKIVVLNAPFG